MPLGVYYAYFPDWQGLSDIARAIPWMLSSKNLDCQNGLLLRIQSTVTEQNIAENYPRSYPLS